MPAVPSSLALTSIADGSLIIAADHRTNYSAVQVGVNGLIAVMATVTAKGDLLVGTGAGALDHLAVGANGLVPIADSTQPSGIRWGAATSTSYRKTTAKQVLNTVTETDLFNGEITLAANDLGTNRSARIVAEGDYINNSAAARIAQQFKLKLGATTLIDVGVPVGNAQSAGATRFGWRVTATISNLTATTQSVYFDAVVTCQPTGAAQGLNNAFATGEGTVVNLENVGDTFAQVLYSGWNAGAVDTTLSQALVLSVINPTATATYDTTLKRALVVIE